MTESALLRQYPELAEKLPHIDLGTFPTPVHRLEHLGFDNLWIKRDDLSSSAYGGNKIRKLEYILAQARKKKKEHLITFGGIGTNHGLATAIFSQKLGLKCTLLLFWQPVTDHVKQNIRLCHKYQARTVYHKTPWQAVVSYYLGYRIKHPSAYFVYAGGSSPIGTIGYLDAAFELKEQIDRGEIPEPAVIICPLGSGGTLAGLSLGLQLAGLRTRVMGVRITVSHLGLFPVCTPKTVARLIGQTYGCLKKHSRRVADLAIQAPTIADDYLGSGYGVPTAAGMDACRAAREKENLVLEPTYTAKTFAAVMAYCRNHQSDPAPVLYWHTYNSVDLTAQAASVDYRQLPEPLPGFIEQEAIPIY